MTSLARPPPSPLSRTHALFAFAFKHVRPSHPPPLYYHLITVCGAAFHSRSVVYTPKPGDAKRCSWLNADQYRSLVDGSQAWHRRHDVLDCRSLDSLCASLTRHSQHEYEYSVDCAVENLSMEALMRMCDENTNTSDVVDHLKRAGVSFRDGAAAAGGGGSAASKSGDGAAETSATDLFLTEARAWWQRRKPDTPALLPQVGGGAPPVMTLS